jgi:hypothetical protein
MWPTPGNTSIAARGRLVTMRSMVLSGALRSSSPAISKVGVLIRASASRRSKVTRQAMAWR